MLYMLLYRSSCVVALQLNFTFTFYGVSYTAVTLSLNGNLQFQTAFSDGDPSTSFGPNAAEWSPFIAFYWCSLNPTGPASLLQRTYGVIGVAPYRQWILRYNNVPYANASLGNVTVDVILSETLNTIQFNYYSISSEVGNVPNQNVEYGVAIGIQNALVNGYNDYIAISNVQPVTPSIAASLTGTSYTFTPIPNNCVARTQYYSFCYVVQNTLPTSPNLLWSSYAQGTINVNLFSSFATAGTVMGITGSRQVYVQGKPLQSNNIIGVIPYYAYGGNDNMVTLTAPFITGPHAVSFYLSGIAQYAAGPAQYPGALNGSPNVSINAFPQFDSNFINYAYAPTPFTESDMPWSDGNNTVIVSQFYMVATNTFNPTFGGCPFSAPTEPTQVNGAVSAYNQQFTWPFCYTFSTGQSDGTNEFLTITIVSGVITTAGYQGSSGGYAVLGISGTRQLVVTNPMTGNSTTYSANIVGVGSPLSPWQQFAGIYKFYTLQIWTGSNILYPASTVGGLAYVDYYGINMITDTEIGNDLQLTYYNLFDFYEVACDVFTIYNTPYYGEYYDLLYALNTYQGSLYIETPYNLADEITVQSQSTFNNYALSLSSWANQQCPSTSLSTSTMYSFCYYIDNSNSYFYGYGQGITYVYGTFGARTGLTRDNRGALQLQSAGGVRITKNLDGGLSGINSSAAITQMLPPNALWARYLASTGSTWQNDNIVFTTGAPYVTTVGLGFVAAPNTLMAFLGGITQVGQYPFLKLYSNYYDNFYPGLPTDMQEYDMGQVTYVAAAGYSEYEQTAFATGYTTSGFSYTPFIPGKVANCQNMDNSVPAISVATYSMCAYQANSNGYSLTWALTIYAYSTPVFNANNNRTGYVIQTITGQRVFINNNGITSNIAINGLNGDALVAAKSGFGYDYDNFDNLIYINGPYVDSFGFLFQAGSSSFSNSISSNGNSISSLGRFWYDEYATKGSPAYYERSTVTNVLNTFNYTDLLISTVALVNDNGASAAAGTVATKYCGSPPLPPLASSSSGVAAPGTNNGNSNGLSGGQIAGIVVGTRNNEHHPNRICCTHDSLRPARYALPTFCGIQYMCCCV